MFLLLDVLSWLKLRKHESVHHVFADCPIIPSTFYIFIVKKLKAKFNLKLCYVVMLVPHITMLILSTLGLWGFLTGKYYIYYANYSE